MKATASPPPKQQTVSPDHIMQTGMAFWASKTLLAAVKMELFTFLGNQEYSAEAIKTQLGLHSRSLYDFLDALVALGFLNRQGIKETARYRNTEETGLFLDKNKPETYMGGVLVMANDRLYPFWAHLEEGLKTGKPQNEIKQGGNTLFDIIYGQPKLLEQFLDAMASIQMGNFMTLAQTFNFSSYQHICDIGGAKGALSVCLARQHPNLHCTSLDLPPVAAIAQGYIDQHGLSDRIRVGALDFFKDSFPRADVFTMGNILHDWGREDKKMLMRKAYLALPAGGALIVIENIIDNDRRKNAFGLLMSLNMLIETPEGYDFSQADFEELAEEVGFSTTTAIPLNGPSSAAIAFK